MDLPDRFILWLMNSFYDDLKADLVTYGEKLALAVSEEKGSTIDLYMKMIKEIRGIISDIEDENFEQKDLVHMIAHKYGLMTDD